MTLPTWGGRSTFRYEGSVEEGTQISWKDKSTKSGWSKPLMVTAKEYLDLLSQLAGRELVIGNYRRADETGTLEDWLKRNYDQWGITSYIGPILIHEGYAVRGSRPGSIRFIPRTAPLELDGEHDSVQPASRNTGTATDEIPRFTSQCLGAGLVKYIKPKTSLDQDVASLVDRLNQAFNGKPPVRIFAAWDTPAMNVLDCVLSLNRKYYAFCAPRLERFNARHPEIECVMDLIRLVESYPTAVDFSVKELDYRDELRSATLVGVCRYMDRMQKSFPGATEMIRLQQWASVVKAEDYEAPQVRGFGLAGFQYLRMLFGAETAKPDVYIRRFVTEAVGHTVDDVLSLKLLETAAKHLGWSLLALDNEIWEIFGKSGKLT